MSATQITRRLVVSSQLRGNAASKVDPPVSSDAIRTPGRSRISSRQGRGDNGGHEQARQGVPSYLRAAILYSAVAQ